MADIRSGGTGSDPAGMTGANGILFFRADDGISGAELWALGAPTTTSITTTTVPTTTSTSTTTTTLPPTTCAPAPRTGCTAFARSALDVDEKRAGKEKLRLGLKGSAQAITPGQLGDPVGGTTRVDVCLYDQAGALVAEVIVDRAGLTCGTKPCWKALGGSGYRYSDKVGGADGTRSIVLKAGPAGKGIAKTFGANDATKGQTALPTGVAAALAGQTQATVQVVTDDTNCFGAMLTSIKKNTAERFLATVP